MTSEREDYQAFLDENGLTDEDILAVSNADPVLYLDCDSLVVEPSPIHGFGVFAAKQIRKGAPIAPALLVGCKTTFGRYVNHSGTPNAVLVVVDANNVTLAATETIEEGTEITVNYRGTDGE